MTAPGVVSPLDAGSLEEIIRNAVELTPYWVEGKTETHQDPYENAARAVLAAIIEAGAVEYAVLVDRNHYKFSLRYLDRAKQFAIIHEGQLLSRIKAGPWTAVD